MPRSNKKKSWINPPLKSPTMIESSSSTMSKPMKIEQSVMLDRAVKSARKQGINLSPGKLNDASGNCAFEAALFNVNCRGCFDDKFPFSTDYYRRLWVVDMKNKTLHDKTWQICSDSEWESGWEEMMESGVYERGLFGDLMLFGISCGLRKRLLIFNTNLDSPHDPIYVCDPLKFGVEPDTEIPVVLAYNMSHYESLHPETDTDVEKTVCMVREYLTGKYKFGKKDLPFLLSSDTSNDESTIDENVVLKPDTASGLKSKSLQQKRPLEINKTEEQKNAKAKRDDNKGKEQNTADENAEVKIQKNNTSE